MYAEDINEMNNILSNINSFSQVDLNHSQMFCNQDH